MPILLAIYKVFDKKMKHIPFNISLLKSSLKKKILNTTGSHFLKSFERNFIILKLYVIS